MYLQTSDKGIFFENMHFPYVSQIHISELDNINSMFEIFEDLEIRFGVKVDVKFCLMCPFRVVVNLL